MKAITVQQPWAWVIVHGGKNVENRTGFHRWARACGQTLAIHAGLRLSARGVDDPRCRAALKRVLGPVHWYDEHVVFGAIIGMARVFAIHQAMPDCCQPWGEREYVEHGGRTRRDVVHLLLDQVRPVDPPIECRGALGLWTVPADVEAELTAVSR